MPFVSGRYANMAVYDRKCDLCDFNDYYTKIGDEFHCIFNCPLFREDRVQYIYEYNLL